MTGLTIRKDPCELDFLSLGALIHRLDPGVIPFRKARSFDIHVSGGEYNVAANLCDCFGLKTGIATAMVNYPIGELVQARVKEAGVAPFYKWFDHDGVRGPNIATVYSDRGHGVRAPVVFYNRANEAGALSKPGDFDWPKIFARGVRWFHSGGIFSALSATTSDLIIEGMAAAKAANAVVSFDLNYRAKLWASVGGAAKGQQVIQKIVGQIDALFGNEEDLQKGLGIQGPEVEAGKSKLDPDTFFGLIERVVARHPNIKLVATTLREVHSTNRHDWAAVLWLDGKRYVSPTCPLDVHDRIGGGDGFASGLIYGLIAGRSPEDALRLGWAHGALLTTFPGDITMAKLEEVEAFAKGGRRGCSAEAQIMEHDQRFKNLLRHFFADFLRLFFAAWAARFDLSHVEWLDKELLPEQPDGPVHVLDMVARVGAKEPVSGHKGKEPWLVLVHIEIEAPDRTTRIKPRLPQYYYHLRSAYGLPVLPIVVFLNVQLDGIGIDAQSEQFWELEVVTFRYLYVGLPGLNGVEYVQGENWLGVALAALMKVPRERAAWLGAEALRRLSGAPVDPHQRFLLVECVQAYLDLDEQQQQEYERIIQTEPFVEVRKMNKTVFEEGVEKGIEKGIEKGQLLAYRRIVMTLLERQFGPVSQKLREHVETLNSDALQQLILRAANAESLEDTGLPQLGD